MAITTITALEGDEKTNSKALIQRKISLNSLQAQKVLRRSYSRLAEAVFSANVVLRARCTREEADAIEALINEHFDKVNEELEQTIVQAKTLLENNGITDSPDYSNRMTYLVEIKSPQAVQFMRQIELLDTIISMVDTLWLNSVLTSSQRSDMTFQWQQRLIRMASRIIGIEKSARVKANRKQQAAEHGETLAEDSEDQVVNGTEGLSDADVETADNKAAVKTSKTGAQRTKSALTEEADSSQVA